MAKPHSVPESYTARRGRATVARVEALEGVWNVERLSGPLPMARVWKRVWGVHGETRAWGSPGIPFVLERCEKCVALV